MTIPIINHKDDCTQFVDLPGIGSINDWFVMTEPYPFTATLNPPLTIAKTDEEITISVFRDSGLYQVDLDMRLGCGVCQAISEDTFDYEDFEYVD